jgi:ribosomal protein S18 acetylase RimI-like enzyme
MKIITVHGIRRHNRWDESFAELEELKANKVEVLVFDYGFFGFFRFIRKSKREEIITKFCEFYSNNFDGNGEPPSVVAHSFGTFIILKSMEKYDTIKFDKIIFCGSILNSKTDFRTFFERNQINYLFNDHGSLEWFLKFTRRLIGKECGNAGKVGFKDVPAKYKNQIKNQSNVKNHSEYFLELHMKQHWLTVFLNKLSQPNYNSDILRPEIIERIYKNIEKTHEEFTINEIKYSARIDSERNYFAKYERKGINDKKQILDTLTFATTADGLHNATQMNFLAYDESNMAHHSVSELDQTHAKTFKISLNKPINYKESVYIKYYFCWLNTINLEHGDTDHWSIKGIRNISISINFPYELTSPRLYEVKDRKIVGQKVISNRREKNGTISYHTEYKNESDCDGLIFYFSGCQIKDTNPVNKSLRKQISEFSLLGRKDKCTIQKAADTDIREIYKIESDIEHTNAATEETLRKRCLMFNEGFLVMKKQQKIIGYIETLVWNEKPFQTFNEISNFPLHFNINGDTLYIIFIAVIPQFRKRGLGKRLVIEIENIAKEYRLKRISLVAKDDLIEFYTKLGYKKVRELPDFLKGRTYKSILMDKYI